MTFETASYEVQAEQWLRHGHTYPVRITPVPAATWGLQAQTHKYRPYLRFWAMIGVDDIRVSGGRSTWTLWLIFPEPPMDHLDRAYHDGRVMFLAADQAPQHLFIPGFTFDLFVGPGGTIARGQILAGT